MEHIKRLKDDLSSVLRGDNRNVHINLSWAEGLLVEILILEEANLRLKRINQLSRIEDYNPVKEPNRDDSLT